MRAMCQHVRKNNNGLPSFIPKFLARAWPIAEGKMLKVAKGEAEKWNKIMVRARPDVKVPNWSKIYPEFQSG